MAAKRNGISTVLIPEENLRDLAEIDPVVRESLRFVPAKTIDTVLAEALYPVESNEERRSAPIITAFVPMEQSVQDAPMRQ